MLEPSLPYHYLQNCWLLVFEKEIDNFVKEQNHRISVGYCFGHIQNLNKLFTWLDSDCFQTGNLKWTIHQVIRVSESNCFKVFCCFFFVFLCVSVLIFCFPGCVSFFCFLGCVDFSCFPGCVSLKFFILLRVSISFCVFFWMSVAQQNEKGSQILHTQYCRLRSKNNIQYVKCKNCLTNFHTKCHKIYAKKKT